MNVYVVEEISTLAYVENPARVMIGVFSTEELAENAVLTRHRTAKGPNKYLPLGSKGRVLSVEWKTTPLRLDGGES